MFPKLLKRHKLKAIKDLCNFSRVVVLAGKNGNMLPFCKGLASKTCGVTSEV